MTFLKQYKLQTITVLILCVLLPAIFIPIQYILPVSAALLAIAAVTVRVVMKKRNLHSVNLRQVLLLMAAIAAVYLMLFYLSGLHFGFYTSYPFFSVDTVLRYVLPSAVIVIATEIIRLVLLAQKGKAFPILAYLICLVADLLLGEGVSLIGEMHRFLDIVAITFLPAVTANLFYHYICVRYGAQPNMVYRLILTLTHYFIPVEPAISEAIKSMFLMFLPLVAYAFLSALFERKVKKAAKKTGVWPYLGMGAMGAVMVSLVLLIAGHFHYSLLVIATPSMEGTLDVGDVVICESYEEQEDEIRKGDVIVFVKENNVSIVHRVVDIEKINGQLRYYTKGDANAENDFGYITDTQIVAKVHFRIPAVGSLTLWLRDLFD